MYKTLGRQCYWPAMELEVYRRVSHCHVCEKERVRARSRPTCLKLFPIAPPHNDSVLEIFGELVKTHKEISQVTTDRFDELVKIVPLRYILAQDIGKVSLQHWVFECEAPFTAITDNGPQFTVMFLSEALRVFGIQKLFIPAYHLEKRLNGKVQQHEICRSSGTITLSKHSEAPSLRLVVIGLIE